MTEVIDRLESALEHDVLQREDDEVSPLVEVAGEVRTLLQQPMLSRMERDRLYARATALASSGKRWAVARRVLLDHKLRTIAGGAAVTLAAGAAITLAVVRQHRDHAPLPV